MVRDTLCELLLITAIAALLAFWVPLLATFAAWDVWFRGLEH